MKRSDRSGKMGCLGGFSCLSGGRGGGGSDSDSERPGQSRRHLIRPTTSRIRGNVETHSDEEFFTAREGGESDASLQRRPTTLRSTTRGVNTRSLSDEEVETRRISGNFFSPHRTSHNFNSLGEAYQEEEQDSNQDGFAIFEAEAARLNQRNPSHPFLPLYTQQGLHPGYNTPNLYQSEGEFERPRSSVHFRDNHLHEDLAGLDLETGHRPSTSSSTIRQGTRSRRESRRQQYWQREQDQMINPELRYDGVQRRASRQRHFLQGDQSDEYGDRIDESESSSRLPPRRRHGRSQRQGEEMGTFVDVNLREVRLPRTARPPKGPSH